MEVIDVFSKREKRRRGVISDVYLYDKMTDKLRNQVVLSLEDCYKHWLGWGRLSETVAECVVAQLRREHGRQSLADSPGWGRNDLELKGFILEEEDVDKILDAIELFVRFGVVHEKKVSAEREESDAVFCVNNFLVPNLNTRFNEDAFGYQIECGQVVRIDSKFMHAKVVKPAITLLSQRDDEYKGAIDEFLKAHNHYRKGRNEAAAIECSKAFESVMRSICDLRGWEYNRDNATAGRLIDVCLRHELVPNELQSELTGLPAVLKGVATIRNKKAAHGKGKDTEPLLRHLVAYALHMTAATIVFLAEAHENLRSAAG